MKKGTLCTKQVDQIEKQNEMRRKKQQAQITPQKKKIWAKMNGHSNRLPAIVIDNVLSQFFA